MQEVHTRTVLIVTLGLLVLSFFSYSTGFGTGHVTASGQDVYNCHDYRVAMNYFLHDEYRAIYDVVDAQGNPGKDRVIGPTDLAWINEQATRRDCPEADECTPEGRKYCTAQGINECVKDEFGVLRSIEQTCPSGYRCRSIQQSGYRGPGAANPFERGILQRDAECVPAKGNFPDEMA
jgi:hypothetical protein